MERIVFFPIIVWTMLQLFNSAKYFDNYNRNEDEDGKTKMKNGWLKMGKKGT